MQAPRFKSEFISGARDIYAKGTSRLDVDRAQTYVNTLLGREVPLTLTAASTKQEVVTNLRDLLQREREPGCCFGDRAAFTAAQLDTLPGNIYDTHLRKVPEFNPAQDRDFIESLGLNVADARLTALTGDETSVLKGLMNVLHAEEPENPRVRAFMEGGIGVESRYPLNADDAMLRGQILGRITTLRQGPAIDTPAILATETAALRAADLANIAFTGQIADCIDGLPGRLPPLFNTPENILTITKMAAGVLTDPLSFRFAGESLSHPDIASSINATPPDL